MNISDYLTILSMGSFVIFTVVGWSIWATWWLGKQFAQTRQLVLDRGNIIQEAIEAKLEYHEQHDDRRFADINNNLWDIRIRNAARDGLPLDLKNKP